MKSKMSCRLDIRPKEYMLAGADSISSAAWENWQWTSIGRRCRVEGGKGLEAVRARVELALCRLFHPFYFQSPFEGLESASVTQSLENHFIIQTQDRAKLEYSAKDQSVSLEAGPLNLSGTYQVTHQGARPLTLQLGTPNGRMEWREIIYQEGVLIPRKATLAVAKPTSEVGRAELDVEFSSCEVTWLKQPPPHP